MKEKSEFGQKYKNGQPCWIGAARIVAINHGKCAQTAHGTNLTIPRCRKSIQTVEESVVGGLLRHTPVGMG
jgi:hypothetical protein